MLKDAFPTNLADIVNSVMADRTAKEAFLSEQYNFIDSYEKLKGDGSNRQFWRVQTSLNEKLIVVAPEKNATNELRESQSVWNIGNHLLKAGVSVPELYGFNQESGVVVCEDLGDTHLHSIAVNTDFESEESVNTLRKFYRETLDQLIVMQVSGAKHFQTEWCWDTSSYDKTLMLERESGYFLRAFWQGMLGNDTPEGVENEFKMVADIAAEAPNGFFLHRDFQSRNVMIKDGKVRIIDFQGGRRGPLGYDLASLLIDPYTSLPLCFQKEMYDYYLQMLEEKVDIDHEAFTQQFIALSLQRNLQILGAFAFLSQVRGKTFFCSYLQPSLKSLKYLLGQAGEKNYPILCDMVNTAEMVLEKTE